MLPQGTAFAGLAALGVLLVAAISWSVGGFLLALGFSPKPVS
ncbi:MAG: hypothetical protein ACXVAC_18520 [Vulcanimicrobiaceae bacterium]